MKKISILIIGLLTILTLISFEKIELKLIENKVKNGNFSNLHFLDKDKLALEYLKRDSSKELLNKLYPTQSERDSFSRRNNVHLNLD